MKFRAFYELPQISVYMYIIFVGSTTGFSVVANGAIIGVTHLKTFLCLEVCERGKLGFFNPPIMRLIGVVYLAKFSMTCIFFVM